MPQYNGVWTLEAAAQAQSNQQWVTDPNFKNTILLLQADNSANTANNSIFLDASVNSLPISRAGNTTQGSFTPFSQAPGWWSNYFGGSTDYVAFTSIAAYAVGTNNYTIEVNVNFSSTAGNQRIFCIGASGTDGLVLQYTGGTGLQLFSAASGSSTVFTYAFTPVVGTWYNFTVVRSGTGTNQVVLYLNGISVATGTSTASVGQNAALVGGISWNSTYTVNGYINNLRLSNTVRYSSNFTPTTSPFASDANTILLTCQNNRFVDNSPTGNTFTIGGTPSVQAFGPFAPQYQWTAPVIGGSGYFDGSGDNLQSTASTTLSIGTGDFTFECWAYVLSTASDPGVMQIAGSTFGTNQPTYSNSIGILIVSGAWSFINNGSYTATATTAITRQWVHLAVSRSGTTHRFFVNGVQAGSVTDSTNYTTQYFAAGCAYGTNYPINAYISNIRFVKGTAVYTGAFTPPTAPLSTSGAASASAYPSTANVSTTFVSTNTQALLNFTNAGIYDGTMENVLETVGNAQVSTSVVKYGSGSMYFDGTGDYLYIPRWTGINANENFTAELWINITAAPANYRMMISDSNGNSSKYWTLNASGMEAQFGTVVSSSAVCTFTFAQNTWYHLALVRNNGFVSMYVNGVAQTVTYANQTASYLDQSSILQVGRWLGSTTTYEYFGYMDDLRITKGIARYTANFIPPQVALPRQ